jgi:hypothetical protein
MDPLHLAAVGRRIVGLAAVRTDLRVPVAGTPSRTGAAMPPVTLDQLSLDLRPRRVWIPVLTLAALLAGASAVGSLLVGALDGAVVLGVAAALAAGYARAAGASRLTLEHGVLTLDSPRRHRVLRLDRLAEVGMWRSRMGGAPTLALVDRDGGHLALGQWFWRGGGLVEAVVGVALAEQPDVQVTNVVANRMDDAAYARWG